MTKLKYKNLDVKNIGKTINRERTIRELAQLDIAGMYDRSTISLIENGRINNLSFNVLETIANSMGLGIVNLLTNVDEAYSKLSHSKKEEILNYIGMNKINEAIEIVEKLDNNLSKSDRKIVVYVYAAKLFLQKKYLVARSRLLANIDNFEAINNTSILSFEDLLLVSGYLSCCFQTFDLKIIHDRKTLDLMYAVKGSLASYYSLHKRSMIRIKIYIFAWFRMWQLYDICYELLEEIELAIKQLVIYEFLVDFNVEKILFYYQQNKRIFVQEIIEQTRLILKVHKLVELESFFEERLQEIEEYIQNI